MIHPPATPPDTGAPLDSANARIVLRLDDAISAFRAGERTGLRALDSASGLMRMLTDEEVMSEAERRADSRRIPRKPDRMESRSLLRSPTLTVLRSCTMRHLAMYCA